MWGGATEALMNGGNRFVAASSICAKMTAQILSVIDAGMEPVEFCSMGIELLGNVGIDRSIIERHALGEIGEACHDRCVDKSIGSPLRKCMALLAKQATGEVARDPRTGPKCERLAEARERKGHVDMKALWSGCARTCYPGDVVNEPTPNPPRSDNGVVDTNSPIPNSLVVTAPPVPMTSAMERPRKIAGRDPEFSREALANRVEGLMIVRCIIELDGTLKDCKVIKNLPYMEEAVLSALATHRYTPGMLDGKPVRVHYTFNIKLVAPQ